MSHFTLLGGETVSGNRQYQGTNPNNIGVRIKERLMKLLDGQNNENIWKEVFINKEEISAPKINNLYNQKSIHI